MDIKEIDLFSELQKIEAFNANEKTNNKKSCLIQEETNGSLYEQEVWKEVEGLRTVETKIGKVRKCLQEQQRRLYYGSHEHENPQSSASDRRRV